MLRHFGRDCGCLQALRQALTNPDAGRGPSDRRRHADVTVTCQSRYSGVVTKDRGFGGATETLAHDMRPAPLGVVLRVTNVEEPPEPFRLEVGRCIVGSAATADLVVNASTVSRQHLELGLIPEGVEVRDLGSRNGTFYKGQRIEKMVVRLGATLKLGTASLAIEPDNCALDDLSYDANEYRGIVAGSAAMKSLFAKLRKLEGSLASVLIEGESGVGKELIAQALHHGSVVQNEPMVVINCGAMPGELVASALFGHRKGAFTGAVDDRVGAFQAADGGTLFLDEVGEMPLDVQPMLLRALEAQEITPVGDQQTVKVEVRVVSATNRTLQDEVAAGRFREDLYYRLAVIKLLVPPLAERRQDVPLLAERFAQTLDVVLPDSVLEQLGSRPWPGNVRELKNAVQVFAALGALPEIRRSPAKSYAELKDGLIDAFTKSYLERLMAHTQGNQTAAARVAGLDRSYLGRLLQKHGLGK